MIDRKELKQNARQIMREARPRAVWVTLMALGVLLVLQVLSLGVNGDLAAYKALAAKIAASGGVALLQSTGEGALSLLQSTGTDSIAGWLLSLAISLMSIVISTGYLLYTLRLSRRQDPGFGDVFDAFGQRPSEGLRGVRHGPGCVFGNGYDGEKHVCLSSKILI